MDAAIGSISTAQVPVGARASSPVPRVEEAPAVPSTNAERSSAETRLTAERSVEKDSATGSLIYRLVDLSSGIVTIQTPSDARLKLRAYIDGVRAQQANPAVEVRA